VPERKEWEVKLVHKWTYKNNHIFKIITINALPGYNWKYGSMEIDGIAKTYTYSIGKKILNGIYG